MFCGNCGTKLKEGAAFCQNCGTPVPPESPASVEEASKPAESPAPVKETPKPAQSPAVSPIPAEPREPGGKKAGNKGAVIVLVVILLLVIGAGAGAAIYFTGDGYNIKKNLKLARQCFEEEEYSDALDYYDRVLDLDDTLVDAYLKSADIYMLQNEYERALELLIRGRKRTREDEEADPLLVDKLTEVYQAAAGYYEGTGDYGKAYAMLREGIEVTEKPALTAALEELYRSEADKYLAEENFYMARDVLKAGAEETGSAALSEMLAETYGREAEEYLEQKSYYDALWVLNEGLEATGDDSLAESKTELYARWAEDNLSQGYYEDALWVLGEGLEATGDSSLAERRTAVYARWAEDCKDAGNYADAMEVLDRGLEETGDVSLTEQKNYLIGHLELARAAAYSGSWLQAEWEYDLNGNLIKCFYYSYGSMDNGYEAEYNEAGEMVVWTQYEDGRLSYITTFDDSGNPVDQTFYDWNGDVESYAYAEVQTDDAGLRQSVIWTGAAESDTVQLKYFYDETGALTAVYRYGWDGTLLKGNEYKDGQVAKQTLYIDGEVYQEMEYASIITDSGQVYSASQIIRDGEGNVDSWNKYEYEFDAMGNALVETGYYGDSYNYDETLSNGYYEYRWTYINEYRFIDE